MKFKRALTHYDGITTHRDETGFDPTIGGGMNNAGPPHFSTLMNRAPQGIWLE